MKFFPKKGYWENWHFCVSQVPTKHWYSATVHSANYCIFPASISMKNNWSTFHYIEEWVFDILRYGKLVLVGTWQSTWMAENLLREIFSRPPNSVPILCPGMLVFGEWELFSTLAAPFLLTMERNLTLPAADISLTKRLWTSCFQKVPETWYSYLGESPK